MKPLLDVPLLQRELPTTGSEVAARGAARLAYIDVLRVALIVLVVAHHAGQAYGPGAGGQAGGVWPISDPAKAAIFSSFFSVNAAFFMGLFFLLSALFVPTSFDRKGAIPFLRDRLFRLGVPLAVVLLVGESAELARSVLATDARDTFVSHMLDYLSLFALGGGYPGHLWFVEHLLVYALLYTAWRALTAHWSPRRLPIPNNAAILGYVLLLALVTFVVRIEYPINRWVYLFGFVYSEVGHLPQYASLFVIGLVAARGQWLQRLPTRRGMLWLGIGVLVATGRYLLPIGTPGGANLGSVIWSLAEAFIATGLCLGLIVLFREYVAKPGRLLLRMAPNTYGVYVVHLFVVLAAQLVLLPLAAPALVKFAVVTVVAVVLSFAATALLRLSPAVRVVL